MLKHLLTRWRQSSCKDGLEEDRGNKQDRNLVEKRYEVDQRLCCYRWEREF